MVRVLRHIIPSHLTRAAALFMMAYDVAPVTTCRHMPHNTHAHRAIRLSRHSPAANPSALRPKHDEFVNTSASEMPRDMTRLVFVLRRNAAAGASFTAKVSCPCVRRKVSRMGDLCETAHAGSVVCIVIGRFSSCGSAHTLRVRRRGAVQRLPHPL